MYLSKAYRPVFSSLARLANVLLKAVWIDHSPTKVGNFPSPLEAFASEQM